MVFLHRSVFLCQQVLNPVALNEKSAGHGFAVKFVRKPESSPRHGMRRAHEERALHFTSLFTNVRPKPPAQIMALEPGLFLPNFKRDGGRFGLSCRC